MSKGAKRVRLIALAKLHGFHHGHHMQTASLELIVNEKIVRFGKYHVQYNVLKGEIQAWTESSRIKTYNQLDAARILAEAEIKAQTQGIHYSQAVAELVVDELQRDAS